MTSSSYCGHRFILSALEGHRYFVSEALVHEEVALEWVGDQVLVRFRNMYIRELNLQRKSTLPFVFPIHHIVAEVLPMSRNTCYPSLDN